MIKVVFMGSAEFSVPSLLALQMAYQVVGVVTQPDRPAGRGRKLTANPIKRMAEASAIPVFQPDSLKTDQVILQLVEWAPDVIVVVAFGQILPRSVLDLPPHGCLNVHASLLPRWRGAAPMPAAILAGDEETGVTVMKMDVGLDTGPILVQERTRMETDETTASLAPRLAELGARLLVDALPGYLDGEISPYPQPEAGVTLAPPLQKTDGLIEWALPVEEIDRQIRAFSPWPGAYTLWEDKRLRILEIIPLPDWDGLEEPGAVFEGQVSPMVATAGGAAWLTRVQLAGKKAMSSDVFLRGQPAFLGSVLVGA